jgi:hypothetical protein
VTLCKIFANYLYKPQQMFSSWLLFSAHFTCQLTSGFPHQLWSSISQIIPWHCWTKISYLIGSFVHQHVCIIVFKVAECWPCPMILHSRLHCTQSIIYLFLVAVKLFKHQSVLHQWIYGTAIIMSPLLKYFTTWDRKSWVIQSCKNHQKYVRGQASDVHQTWSSCLLVVKE